MAIYRTYAQKQELPEGTELWGYAFKETDAKDGAHLKQAPIKGKIGPYVRYRKGFAPFKKGSDTEIARSKAVNLDSRNYADTEEEAVREYNKLVQRRIRWHEERITELMSEIVYKENMNLQEALQAAMAGNFVTNDCFSRDQSLHYYRGQFYYEDGAVVTEDFLESQDFAVNESWRIIITSDSVDTDRLADMHKKNAGRMLQTGSYMDCKKS